MKQSFKEVKTYSTDQLNQAPFLVFSKENRISRPVGGVQYRLGICRFHRDREEKGRLGSEERSIHLAFFFFFLPKDNHRYYFNRYFPSLCSRPR